MDSGIEFATLQSCVDAVMRITCDKRINGESSLKPCAVKPDSRPGRSFGIVPYSVAKYGFIDLDVDDFGDETFLDRFQKAVIKLRGDDWH
jgi:hypothetical protein